MSVGWGRKGLSLVAAVSIVGSIFLLPAVAHKSGERHGDRDHGPGIAVVETYDATTNQLVLATKHFGVVTLTVSETAKFGVVGWGKHLRGGGGGFHLGTEADVVPGAVVVHSKVEEGLVTKMLLFLPRVDDCAEHPSRRTDDGDGDEDDSDDGDQDECEEPDDDDCDDESDSRSAANSDHECGEPDDDDCEEGDDGEDPESDDRNGDEDGEHDDDHEDDDEVECPDADESPEPDEPDAPEGD